MRDGIDVDIGSAEEDPTVADKEDEKYRSIVMRWLEKVVIGLKLCPWALPALNADAIKILVHRGEDVEGLCDVILGQVSILADMSEEVGQQNATVLVVVPDMLQDFEDFLDLNQ